MKLFNNLFVFYFKQMIKSYLYLGLMVFMVVMLVSRVFIHINEEFDYMVYDEFVGEMTVVVQATIILIIIFFYRLISDEFNIGTTNSFSGDSSYMLIVKLLALFFNHLTFMIFFIALQIAIVFLYFSSSGIPLSEFYFKTGLFIVIYWFLPFILSFFIGVFIALFLGKNKLSFVLIILVWILLGPMNTTLFSPFFSNIISDDPKNLFYIGPFHISESFNAPIGYNLTVSSFLKILFWILLSLALILLALLKIVRSKIQKSLIYLSVFSITLVNIVIYVSLFKDSQPSFFYAEKKKEVAYYQKNIHVVPLEQLKYDIRKYHIQLNLKEQPSAKVDITLENVNSTNISFVLYHSYPIQSITDNQGNKLSFKRKGDIITISPQSDHPLKQLSFVYNIKDTFMFPVSKNYLYLPNYFSWIPTKTAYQPFTFYKYLGEEDSIKIHSSQSSETIDYTLDYTGGLPIHTNLSKNINGIYSGYVAGGITIIAGQVSTRMIDGDELIYPNSWKDISNDWKIYKNVISKVHKKTIEIFDLENQMLPNKYFLINPSGEYNSYLSNDHLIIHHGTLLNISSAINEVPEVYIPALLWNKDKRNVTNYEQVSVFNSITSNLIKNELEMETDFISPWDGLINVPETFSSKFESLTDIQQKEFLLLWYSEMHNISNWSDTETLLKAVLKGELK